MPGSLLARRNVRLLVGAVGLSALGDWLALTPLSLAVAGMSGSGVQVAALFIALWGPAVLLARPAGALVDRHERRRLLAVLSVAQAVVAVLLAFSDSSPLIIALAVPLGILFAFATPAEFALAPGVVEPERLAELNGHVETARYAGFTIGPLAGGALSAAGGMQVALLIDAATFVVVAIAAMALRVRAPAPAAAQEDVGRAHGGLSILFADRVLGLVMAVGFASLLFMTASVPAEVFFAKDVLHTGDTGYGALIASWTLGMAVGALAVAKRYRAALASGSLGAIVVQSVGLAAPTLWPVLVFALLLYAVGGLAHGVKNVLTRTLLHQGVPEHLHGRAFAAWNALRNGAELVALAGGGLLVAALGARWTLFLAGAIPAAAGIAGLALHARMRRSATLETPQAERG